MPEYENTGYGRPWDGTCANVPKMNVKTIIVITGWMIAQATPINDCL